MPKVSTVIKGKDSIRLFLLHNREQARKKLAQEIDYVGVNDKEEVIYIFYKGM